ncbi:MAG: YraN family protein [Flavobacteriaceae bacterium]
MTHWSESFAACYLRRRGLRLLQRNYQCRWGEIDLVMEHPTTAMNTLVFVEVRYRKNVEYGSPEETITRSKQQRIIATANHYLQKHFAEDRPLRFDVVAITWPNYTPSVTWIPEAFT